MEKIFELARQLGEALSEHPIGKKYQSTRETLDDDSAAMQLIQNYEQVSMKLVQKEKQGHPIEPEEKKTIADLQNKLAGNTTIKSWMEAQVEYMNLLRQINDLVMKEVQPASTE